MLLYKKLYRCSNKYKNTVIKLLEIFRKNFTKEIILPEGQLPNFFSIIEPSIKSNLQIEDEQYKKIKKYIPAELCAKLYLDYNEKNYILADVKFNYDDIEFNPLESNEPEGILSRNTIKETKLLNMFIKSGFMLDQKNNRLVLADEDKIYKFLTEDINLYMKKFQVLATDNFKEKEIKSTSIVNIGVRIENNLLDIDFSNLNFDVSELQEIMKKYKLKKKYYRLKNGSFVKLEDNDTIKFINSITEDIDVDYSQIKNNNLKLPMYRALYLDKILEKNTFIHVTKDEKYKSLVENVSIKDIDGSTEIPKSLNANLREYQKIGVKWLRTLEYYGLGGILADDMGLGKTVQILCVICSYLEEKEEEKKTILVVCPSSLCLNWQNEIEKFTIGVNSIVIHGSLEERQKQISSIPQFNIAITSYELLKRDIEEYQKYNYKFKYIIADEAQYIKNNNTQNAKAIKNINAEIRYALTGTPIENSLSELWSIFDFIMPGYLFGYRKFKELYETPIVKDNDEKTMQKLKKLIEPFVLRRIKGEVLTELPDKMVTVLNSQMEEEQQEIYMSYLAQAKKNAMQEIKENGIEKSQIKILALLTRLRQICCHPSLFIDNYKGKSGKLNQCIQIVKDAIQAGHKILLFSGYTAMFEIIEKELKKENIEYLKLTGQTKVSDRINLVNEFNNNPDKKLFLISLKAGGTGLNLIGADMVIHYDPWWNLSAENQATDRTYRIGQKRNVQVYKLITKNSIEEKIYELQKRKETLIDNMLSTNQTFISKLSKEDIMSLFE
ncbi:MAG: DEAD/DEAH box helicase [Clostridia bacterium]